jgi:hypothetical protein
MLLTIALTREYEAICTLAEHRLASGLSASAAGLYADDLIGLAEPVKAFFRSRPQLRDPGDELVLDACAGGESSTLSRWERGQLRKAVCRWGWLGMQSFRNEQLKCRRAGITASLRTLFRHLNF